MILIALPSNSPQPSGQTASPKVTVSKEAGSSVDSNAMTRDGISAELGEQYKSVISDDEYRLAESDEPDLVSPPVQSTAMPSWNAETPLIPSSEWTSESTNKTRQYLLVGFLGVAGTCLAAVLFVGFLRWYSADRPPEVASINDQSGTNDSVVKPLPNEPALEPLDGKTSEVDTADLAGDNTAATPSEQNNQLNEDSVTQPPTTEPPGNQTLLPNADSVVAATDTADPTPTQPPPLDLPKQLRAFGDVLAFELQPQFPDAVEILAAAPVTAEELGLGNSKGIDLPTVDVASQSQAIFPAILIAERPLSQFASLWSNTSGIPTTIDLDSLAAAGIDRNQKVGLGLSKSETTGSLSEKIFSSLGLASELQDNQFVRIFAPNDLIEEKLPASLSLAGLVAGEADEQWLVASLSGLLPPQQVPWQISDGKLQRPQQIEPRDWFSALKLIEGWRLAAGMQTTLSDFTAQQLSSAFLSSNDVAGLNKVLTEVQAQERPLSQILPRICSEAAIHAWLDWPSLATLGVGTHTTALVITADRPLVRALANYAEEFSIVFAIVDPQTLLLTSNQTYRMQPQLFVMPSDNKTPEQWISLLRPFTPAGVDGIGNVVAIPTPDGKFMLIRCCRPVVNF